MKVSELIKELQKLDPDAIVYKSYPVDNTDSDDYGWSGDEERQVDFVTSYEDTIEERLGPRGGIRKTKIIKVVIQ